MKKILLIAVMLLSLSLFSQESKGVFVRDYTKFIVTKNNIKESEKLGKVSVVYNEGNTTNIAIYYTNKKILLYSSGNVQTGKTTNGQEYQAVKCINSEDNSVIVLQLFDNELRIFTDLLLNNSIEFYN